MNKKFWDGLSKSDQLIIEAAASMENDVMMAEYNAKNGEWLSKLVNEQGVQLRQFSDEIFDSFGEAADEVFAGVVEHSDLAKRVSTRVSSKPAPRWVAGPRSRIRPMSPSATGIWVYDPIIVAFS